MYSILKEKKISIPFAISACVRDVLCAEDILSKLKSVGLYKVFVGIESFNQRQLDFYNKNVRVEDNINDFYVGVVDRGLDFEFGFNARAEQITDSY